MYYFTYILKRTSMGILQPRDDFWDKSQQDSIVCLLKLKKKKKLCVYLQTNHCRSVKALEIIIARIR